MGLQKEESQKLKEQLLIKACSHQHSACCSGPFPAPSQNTSGFMGTFSPCSREVDAVLRYLKQQCHAQKIGVVGFCWGGVAVHHLMMTYPEFRAGVSIYGKSALYKFTQ